jgi:DNA-binding transcriptional regulator YdaS (Cro superfamily)
MHQEALKRAITICGGQAALAAKIGRKQQHVWFWLNEAKKLPADVAPAIEVATDGKVTRYELCPDVFGNAA